MGVFLRRSVPAPQTCTVTISGKFNANAGYAVIEETKYTDEATVEVGNGTTVDVHVGGLEGYAYVALNGTLVMAGTGTYSLKVTADAELVFTRTVSEQKIYFVCDITMG